MFVWFEVFLELANKVSNFARYCINESIQKLPGITSIAVQTTGSVAQLNMREINMTFIHMDQCITPVWHFLIPSSTVHTHFLRLDLRKSSGDISMLVTLHICAPTNDYNDI